VFEVKAHWVRYFPERLLTLWLFDPNFFQQSETVHMERFGYQILFYIGQIELDI